MYSSESMEGRKGCGETAGSQEEMRDIKEEEEENEEKEENGWRKNVEH